MLDPNPQRHPDNSLQSQIWGLYQTLKLKIAYGFAFKNPGRRTKNKSPVIYKHRGNTILRYAIHILPIAAALVLVVLNCKQYYIGGELSGPGNEDIEKLAVLAFAAKLHEFLMLVSIATIVFTYIRRELVLGTGIPLDALFVGLRIDSISMLWSPEFLGTLYGKWKASRRRKAVLVLVFLVFAILGLSVGISSVTLMTPHLDNWPAGGTSFWLNATSDVLYPQTVEDSTSLAHCAVDTGDAACPYGDWQLIQQEYHAFWPRLLPMGSMPIDVDVSSPFSLRAMRIFQRSSSDDWPSDLGSIWGGHFSLATVPTSPIADGLAEVARLWARAVAATDYDRYQWREDVQFTVVAPQSSVYARCSENIVVGTLSDKLQLSFPVLDKIRFADGNTFDGTVLQDGFEIDSNSGTVATVNSLLAPGLPPALTWIDDAELLSITNSTLLAIATFPNTTASTPNFYTCSLDSRLTSTAVTTFRNQYKLVSGVPPNWANGTVSSPWPRIMPSAAWARYMNPTIAGPNVTAFSSIASTAGIWNTTLTSEPYNFDIIVEGILTTMLANGLARASYNTNIISTLKGNNPDGNQWDAIGWFQYFFGKETSIFDVSAQEQAFATEFTMSAYAIGYSYSYKGSTQKAAIAVLFAYIIFALLHLGYLLWTSRKQVSRHAVPGITALVMDSRQTEILDNTGSGIATGGAFVDDIEMRSRDGDRQFTFGDSQANAFYIRRNSGYG